MRRILAGLEAEVRAHEDEEHAGMPCVANRVSALSYLAYGLGLEPRHGQFIASTIKTFAPDFDPDLE